MDWTILAVYTNIIKNKQNKYIKKNWNKYILTIFKIYQNKSQPLPNQLKIVEKFCSIIYSITKPIYIDVYLFKLTLCGRHCL